MKSWFIPVLLSLLSLVISGYVNYNQTDKANGIAISVLQTQRAEDEKRLERIERGVTRLDDKIDEVLRAVR